MKPAIGLLLIMTPLMAHHSVKAEHDTTKIVTFKGTVTRVEFINPHAHFYMDIVGPDGAVTNWAFEMRSPNAMMSIGLRKDSLKEGEQISVEAYAAKDGARFASARTLIWPDGRSLDVHDSFGGQK